MSTVEATHTRIFLGVGLAIVCLAAGIRIAAAHSDLWFDEVWTLELIRQHAGASDFLGPRHNNNHPLNTWFLQLVGPYPSTFLVHRLHSLAAGIASVVLAGLIGLRRGRLECLFAMGLIGASYPLIHYSSEARGYSMMVCFGLAAFYALQHYLDRPSLSAAASFWAASVLGALSQLLFVQFAFAAGLWSLVVLVRRGVPLRALGHSALLHGPVAAVFIGLYVRVVLQDLAGGGAVATGPLIPRLVQALSLSIGGPAVPGVIASACAVLALGLFGWALARLRGSRDTEELFYFGACLLAPGLFLVIVEPWAVFVRYFLLPIAFFLLALGLAAADFARSPGGRGITALAFAFFLFANATHTVGLLCHGHGQYLAALEYMAANSQAPRVTIGSDHRFRNGMLIRYYAPLLPSEEFRYVDEGGGPPEWFIRHHDGSEAGRGLEAFAYEGRLYRLERIFRTSELSGFDWRIYRRGEAAPEL